MAQKVKVGELQLKDKLVYIGRVAKVVKGGRRFSFTSVIVVGDGNGHVGIGLGKANEVSSAIAKGSEDARKNIVYVPLRKGTLPHSVIGKYGAGRVLLKPASPGTGVIAGGGVRAVLEAVGIQDVLTKSLGSSNPHNMVKATMSALRKVYDAKTLSSRRNVDPQSIYTV
jgi:small subunit ribosomal protein S5